MSKLNKTLMAVLAFLPILFIFYYIYTIVNLFADINVSDSPDAIGVHDGIMNIFIVAALMAISTLMAMVFYIIHAVKNEKFTSNDRLMWILIIVFASMITIPIYWFMIINKEEVKEVE